MRFDPPDFLADAALKPWLVVGKGPSLDGFARFDEFTCLTLNHACPIGTGPKATAAGRAAAGGSGPMPSTGGAPGFK